MNCSLLLDYFAFRQTFFHKKVKSQITVHWKLTKRRRSKLYQQANELNTSNQNKYASNPLIDVLTKMSRPLFHQFT